jgi:hypothetical protein
MAVRLLQERARNDESKWAHYLPSLPAHIPALWWLAATESPLLREAQYPTVVKQASLMAADVRRTYDKVRPGVPPRLERFSTVTRDLSRAMLRSYVSLVFHQP